MAKLVAKLAKPPMAKLPMAKLVAKLAKPPMAKLAKPPMAKLPMAKLPMAKRRGLGKPIEPNPTARKALGARKALKTRKTPERLEKAPRKSSKG